MHPHKVCLHCRLMTARWRFLKSDHCMLCASMAVLLAHQPIAIKRVLSSVQVHDCVMWWRWSLLAQMWWRWCGEPSPISGAEGRSCCILSSIQLLRSHRHNMKRTCWCDRPGRSQGEGNGSLGESVQREESLHDCGFGPEAQSPVPGPVLDLLVQDQKLMHCCGCHLLEDRPCCQTNIARGPQVQVPPAARMASFSRKDIF